MRPAGDLPECYDVHGAYQSGFVDDQMSGRPFYNMQPSKRQRETLRSELWSDTDEAVYERELQEGLRPESETAYLESLFRDEADSVPSRKRAPPLEPLDFEDGGVTVYRPLLGFGEDHRILLLVQHAPARRRRSQGLELLADPRAHRVMLFA